MSVAASPTHFSSSSIAQSVEKVKGRIVQVGPKHRVFYPPFTNPTPKASSSTISSNATASSSTLPPPSNMTAGDPSRNFLPATAGRALTNAVGRQATRSASTEAGAASKSAGPVKDFLRTPVMLGALPFINGGLSGMVATAVIQPVDMVKVRLQLAGNTSGPRPTFLSTTKQIIASGKAMDLYTGLSAGLLRQAVYTTARIGFFETFMRNLSGRGQVGFKERAGAGLAAGGIAAFLGNPADLALIRMQADGLKPVAERANYRSVIHALTSITKSEGVLSLWNGSTPTIVRAMALNFGQLAFFSEAKGQLKEYQARGYHNMNPQSQALLASAAAGFMASFFSLPFDFVKTRMQQQAKSGGKKLNMVGMFGKIAKEEGMFRFYRNFGSYYARIAPHAMVTLLVADYLGFLTK